MTTSERRTRPRGRGREKDARHDVYCLGSTIAAFLGISASFNRSRCRARVTKYSPVRGGQRSLKLRGLQGITFSAFAEVN